jgi:glycosyltransferase involved in cell wall biosynthesis
VKHIIFILSFSRGASGPTSVIIPITKHLISIGYSITIIDTSRQYDAGVEKVVEIELNANYLYFRYTKTCEHSLNRVLDSYFKDTISHIHGIFNLKHKKLARIMKKRQIPYVVSPHGGLMKKALSYHSIRKRVSLRIIFNDMLVNASRLHALGSEEALDISELQYAVNISIIPNGIHIIDVPRAKCYDEKTLKLLFLGRIDINHKGIDKLFKALILAETEISMRNVILNIVGPYSSSKDKRYVLKMLDINPVLKKIVNVVGPKYGDEKYEELNNCNVFIHTSRYEGMPIAILEAMSIGKACMVTPGTNMVEIIKKSNGGFIAGGEVEQIASTLKKVLALSNSDIEKLGKNAQFWSSNNLGWKNIASSYDLMYKEIL